MGRFRRRGQLRWMAGAVSALVPLTACTSTAHPEVTVTNHVTVAGTATSTGQGNISPSVAQTPGSLTSPGATTGAGTSGSSTATAASSGGAAGSGPAHGTPAGVVVKTEPDGFKITKLKLGQKASQFVVFSFDGTGWDEKWQYWFGIMNKVPLHFTGFLSGTYMLGTDTKDKSFAGLYELWPDPAKDDDDPTKWLWTATIITTDAHGPAGEIHDRTPVILPADRIDTWLDPAVTDTATVKALLADITIPALDLRAVSTRVNRVGTNTPELVDPLDARPDQTLQLSLTA